jgi:natural product precursor
LQKLQQNEFIIYFIKNFNYFCSMKKINLKGISETLSEKELKNVMGGSDGDGSGGSGWITYVNTGNSCCYKVYCDGSVVSYQKGPALRCSYGSMYLYELANESYCL